MDSATDKPHDARAESAEPDAVPAAANLPALIDNAPQPPMPLERLAAAPEDAAERFAFALWGAGRKDEAVEFLERQIARHKDGGPSPEPTAEPTAEPAPAVMLDAVSPEITLDVVPSRGDLPPPPWPKRPFVLTAGLAAAIALVWIGPANVAAVPERLGLTQLALWTGDAPAADPAATLEAALPAEEKAAAAPEPVIVAASEELGEASAPVREVEGAPAPFRDAPGDAALLRRPGQPRGASEASARSAGAAPAFPSASPAITGSVGATQTKTAEAAPPPESPPESSDEPFLHPDAAQPVTLERLAAAVEGETRLPRPRPEPSPELVAALAAEARAAPARRVAEPARPFPPSAAGGAPVIVSRGDHFVAVSPNGVPAGEAPLIVAEPPQHPVFPPPAEEGELTILGRVVGPVGRAMRPVGRVVRPAMELPRAATRLVRRSPPVESPPPQFGPPPSWAYPPPAEPWRYPPPPTVYAAPADPYDDGWYYD